MIKCFKTRRTVSFILFALVCGLLTATGCGKKDGKDGKTKKGGTSPETEAKLASYVPADAIAFVRCDLAALRSAKWVSKIMESEAAGEARKEMTEDVGLDPLQKCNLILVGLYKGENVVVAAAGDFTAEEVKTLLKEKASEKKVEIAEVKHGDHTIMHDPKTDMAVCLPAEGMLVAGKMAGVKSALDNAREEKPTAAESERMKPLLAKVGSGFLQIAADTEAIAAESPAARQAAMASEAAISADVSKGLKLQAYVKMKDTQALGMIAGSKQMLSQKAQQTKGPGAEILNALLAGLSIETDQEAGTANITLDIDAETMDNVAQQMVVQLEEARVKARRAQDASNLKQIAVACMMYSQDHDQQWPKQLAELHDKYIPSEKVFVSPADEDPPTVGGVKTSYVYLGRMPKNIDPNAIIAYTRKGVFEEGRNCLRRDGAVQWVPEDKIAARFQQSYDGATKSLPDATDEQIAQLKKFYGID